MPSEGCDHETAQNNYIFNYQLRKETPETTYYSSAGEAMEQCLLGRHEFGIIQINMPNS